MNQVLDVPKPGTKEYIAAQKIACKEVSTWFEKFGWNTHEGYAAAYAAASAGFAYNSYYPSLRAKKRKLEEEMRSNQMHYASAMTAPAVQPVLVPQHLQQHHQQPLPLLDMNTTSNDNPPMIGDTRTAPYSTDDQPSAKRVKIE